jgi:hypothetical protein
MKLQFALLIPTLCPLFAQNVALPITMGYTEPAPFQAAPGQVVTLFLDDISFGVDGRFRSARAALEICPKASQGSPYALHSSMDLRCRRRSSPCNRNSYVA